MISRLYGVKKAVKDIKAYNKKLGPAVERGMTKAALLLLRESQKIVPVDTGNLKASGQVQKRGSGFKAKIDVVYTASYAVYVHENLDAYHRPPTSAKFVEIPARKYQRKLAQIVLDEAKKR